MSNAPYVGQNARSFNVSPEFDGYSKVVIVVTDELEYSAGTDTGRTLTLTCPWGTQAMANNILADIKGYKYHPYNATGAFLDPSAEIGDGVTVNGVYSGIYTMDVTFGGDCRADISAPMEEEIDHEYPYVPKQERTVTRKLNQFNSEFKVQADQISAKVSKTGGNNESFSWELDEKSWTLKAKNKTVLLATEDGVEIEGKITATKGSIGGFDIESDHLSYNKQTWMGTNTLGAYIGINGIQLGKNFRVDMSGNLYAASGEFSGGRIGGFDIMSDYLSYNKQTWMGINSNGAYIGIHGIQMGKNFRVDMMGNLYAASGEFSGTVRAANIKYGVVDGVNYGTINGGAISVGSISGGQFGQLSASVNTSLGYANYSNRVFEGKERLKSFAADTLSALNINVANKINLSSMGKFYWGTNSLYLDMIKDADGEIHRVVKWRG